MFRIYPLIMPKKFSGPQRSKIMPKAQRSLNINNCPCHLIDNSKFIQVFDLLIFEILSSGAFFVEIIGYFGHGSLSLKVQYVEFST